MHPVIEYNNNKIQVEKAKKTLQIAKELEQKRIADGWRWVNVLGTKTQILKKK